VWISPQPRAQPFPLPCGPCRPATNPLPLRLVRATRSGPAVCGEALRPRLLVKAVLGPLLDRIRPLQVVMRDAWKQDEPAGSASLSPTAPTTAPSAGQERHGGASMGGPQGPGSGMVERNPRLRQTAPKQCRPATAQPDLHRGNGALAPSDQAAAAQRPGRRALAASRARLTDL